MLPTEFAMGGVVIAPDRYDLNIVLISSSTVLAAARGIGADGGGGRGVG